MSLNNDSELDEDDLEFDMFKFERKGKSFKYNSINLTPPHALLNDVDYNHYFYYGEDSYKTPSKQMNITFTQSPNES